MAINLGDVNFRLGADVIGLARGVIALENFSRTVEKAQNKTSRGAAQTAAALRRQEKAAADSLRTVLNLNAQLRKTDLGESLIRNSNRAWQQYSQTLTSGKLSALDFQRATIGFNTELAYIKRTAGNATVTTNGFSGALRKASQQAVLIHGPLGGIATRLTTLASIADSSNAKMAAFFAGVAAGSFAIIKFGAMLIRTGKLFNQYENALEGVTGSQGRATAAINEAINIANISGQRLQEVIPAYTRFMAATKDTAIQGSKARDIFTSVAKVAGQLQLPAEQVGGTFRALEQIISKGTVQAEELRGQLGDRLPGAFQIAARAMEMTTAELNDQLKQGKVLSEDFLPKFAKELEKTYGTDTLKMINNVGTAQNRLLNSVTLLFKRFADLTRVNERLTSLFNSLTIAVNWLTRNLENIGKVLTVVLAGFTRLISAAIYAGLAYLATMVMNVTKAIWTMNIALQAPGLGTLVNFVAMVVTALVLFRDEINTVVSAGTRMVTALTVLGGALGGAVAVGAIAAAAGMTRFAGALGLVRTAMLRTGFLALVVVLGEVVSWLDKARERVGGFALLWPLLWDVVVEFFDKFKLHLPILSKSVELQAKTISYMWYTLMAGLSKVWADFLHSMAGAVESMRGLPGMEDLFISLKGSAIAAGSSVYDFQTKADEAADSVTALTAELKALQDQQNAPYESIKAINALMADGSTGRHNTRGGPSMPDIPPLNIPTSVDGKGGAEALKKQIAALKEYQKAIRDVTEEIFLLGTTPAKVKEVERALKISKTLDEFREKFLEAGFSVEFTEAKLASLQKFLEHKDVMTDWAERVRGGFEAMQNSLASGVDSMVSALGDSIMEGKNILKSLADTAGEVARDIMNTLLQMTIANPLKNWLFGMNEATLGGGVGFGGGGGFLAGIGKWISGLWGGGSRNGNAFNQSGLIRLANGGILSRPTVMASGSGHVLGGEAGQEAIMPLTRTASGRMGVLAIGGNSSRSESPSVFINIQTPPGTEAKQERRTDSNGNEFVDIIISTVNNAALTGKLDKGVGAAYNLRRGVNKR